MQWQTLDPSRQELSTLTGKGSNIAFHVLSGNARDWTKNILLMAMFEQKDGKGMET